MNQITDNTASFAPAVVLPEGKTSTDKKLSVVRQADGAALMAIAGEKGKVGNAARDRLGNAGLRAIAVRAAQGNYKPMADYLAAATGEPVVISSRATFESLPDHFEGKILAAKSAKDGGFKNDPKTGIEVPSAKHALALRLKAACVEIIAMAAEAHAERRAQQEQAAQQVEQQ